jgi:hypothetical protein
MIYFTVCRHSQLENFSKKIFVFRRLVTSSAFKPCIFSKTNQSKRLIEKPILRTPNTQSAGVRAGARAGAKAGGGGLERARGGCISAGWGKFSAGGRVFRRKARFGAKNCV